MIFKRNKYTDLEPILIQIYGELNRIRLSMNDPQKAKEIMEFDAKHNGYVPFFDDFGMYNRYPAAKARKVK